MIGSRSALLGVALRRAPVALGLGAVALFMAACNQVGTQSLTFWDVMWSMVWFFFLFMAITIWFTVLMDIFRRNDMSGGMKAVWVLVCFFIPLLGCIIYMVMRPKATAQDVQMMAQAEAAQKAAAGVSTADELAKLEQLKAAGTISEAEFQSLKAKIIA